MPSVASSLVKRNHRRIDRLPLPILILIALLLAAGLYLWFLAVWESL